MRALLPEKDLPVLAACVAGGCGYLVTGDVRHFGGLMGRSDLPETVPARRLRLKPAAF